MGRTKQWMRLCTAASIALWAFACSDGGNTTGTTGGKGGAGGEGGIAQASSSSSSSGVASSSSSGAVGAGGFGGAPMAFVCDPPAEPGSLFELSEKSYDINDIEPVSMCKYRGKVTLIVNTAAICGYTPQYAGLQVLEDTFSSQGFAVLGFLSNDFNQGGSEGQIDGCIDKYGLTFKQFAIGHVRDVDGAGPEQPQPVWKWLLAQPDPGPASGLEPTWNFHKYLISKDGKLVKHWASQTYPGDDPNDANDSFDTNEIVMAIKAELAK